MGIRGRGASPLSRAPHKNTRGNARSRAQEVTEYSPAYWDLIIGEPRHWADPFDPERRRAWREWRERIFARWASRLGHYGERPQAWFAFDLRVPKCVTVDELRAMSREEIVYRFAAGPNEKIEIEEQWGKDIELARLDGKTGAALRKYAIGPCGVPGWFFDQTMAAK
jgi:hypothetical protein